MNGKAIKLKIIGITGDLPALKIALNFIAHNGYSCCFFCFIHGIHVGGKRQYPCDYSVDLRTPTSFARDSKIAAELKRNEKGHLGACVFTDLVDYPLPYSIIIDYAHATLLRHSKAIFSEVYRRLSPMVRNDVDKSLFNQRFPTLLSSTNEIFQRFIIHKVNRSTKHFVLWIPSSFPPALTN